MPSDEALAERLRKLETSYASLLGEWGGFSRRLDNLEEGCADVFPLVRTMQREHDILAEVRRREKESRAERRASNELHLTFGQWVVGMCVAASAVSSLAWQVFG